MPLLIQETYSKTVSHKPILPKTPTRPERESDFYVHPTVYLTDDPVKGKGTTSTVDLAAGTLLFIDSAYALIPTVTLGTEIHPLCSRLQCSRKVVRNAATIYCSNQCTTDVVWCSHECQKLSRAAHEFECLWLKTHSQAIREECGERDFHMLWLMVRTLAQRHLELVSSKESINQTSNGGESFASDWNALCGLRSNQEDQQPLKLVYWRSLVDNYLVGKHTMLPDSLDADAMLTLLCREETNSYDLWPCLIGAWPPRLPSDERGECYAWTMYLRIVFLNHSCIPNIMHRPLENGRMGLYAARDIPAGEEFTLAYFDLVDYEDVKERRKFLKRDFRFDCACPRCLVDSNEVEL